MTRSVTMSSKQGFTLIELVIVIVILGILAVVALPRFVDFADDARVSVLKAAANSINTAVTQVRAAHLLAPNQAIVLEGTTVAVSLLAPNAPKASANLATIAGLSTDDFEQVPPASAATANSPATSATQIAFIPRSAAASAKGLNCNLVYTEPASATVAPTVVIFSSGC
jgi:MSHA pilin protein MshA